MVDRVLQQGLLSAVTSGWPLAHALALLSDKNHRRYAHLGLRGSELSPLVAPTAPRWRLRAAHKAQALRRWRVAPRRLPAAARAALALSRRGRLLGLTELYGGWHHLLPRLLLRLKALKVTWPFLVVGNCTSQPRVRCWSRSGGLKTVLFR